MCGQFFFSLRIVKSYGRERKANRWRVECRRKREGLGYCTSTERLRAAGQHRGPIFANFLVRINQQLACINHLLICRGQEQPKTLLVAEQREKKTFIIKTERRLKRQSRQVHNTMQTVQNGPVSHAPCLQAISYENSKWLRHL